MADLPRNLVVRAHAPVRRTVLTIAFVIIGLFALYVVYEIGRYDAGYDRLAVSQQQSELEIRIEGLVKTNRELRTKLAELDTIRIGRNQERAELARTIGELQAQVARQQQDLAFYRGIVTGGGSSTIGVKIHQLKISAADSPGAFRVRLTIMQSVRPDEPVAGAVTLRVEGDSQGSATSLDFPTLTQGKQRELPFNFRFLENFDQQIAIPDGFRPEKLTVEVRSDRKGVTALTQSYLWRVDAL
jgi:hypothetical protein